MNTITLLGLSIIFFYCITQVLNFYGVGQDVYGVYVLFYLFLIICMLVLPNEYPKVV
jgi:hypothetical protein